MPTGERTEVTKVEPGVFQVLLCFGFMEEPDVPAELAAHQGPRARSSTRMTSPTSSAGSRSSPARRRECTPLAEQLFVLLNRGADSASRFFNLPAEQVFEVGTQVEI